MVKQFYHEDTIQNKISPKQKSYHKMYLVYKSKYVSLEYAYSFMISYTYSPLIT